MKRIISLYVLLLAFSAFTGVSYACDHNITLSPNPSQQTINKLVGQTVNISCASSCNICGSSLSRHWSHSSGATNISSTTGYTSTFSCRYNTVGTYYITFHASCSGANAERTWTINVSPQQTTVNLITSTTTGGFVTSPATSLYTCNLGTNVLLGVSSQPGYHFVGWIGDTSTIVGNYILMDNNYSITAVFETNLSKGPYLVYEGDNSMTVHWQFTELTNCTLEWSDDPTFTTTLGSVNQSVTLDSEYAADNKHSYKITGLDPDTLYYYRLNLPSNQSFPASFRTAPASNATHVKFMVTGDCQGENPAQNDLSHAIQSIYQDDPEYQTILLPAGDKVDNDAELDWTGFFDRSDNYTQDLLAHIALQSCLGNHETKRSGDYGQDPTYCDKYWQYPYVEEVDGITVDEHYWSFDYGPAHIVVLDQYAEGTYDDDNPTNTIGETQLSWLTQDLYNSDKEWKFIILHEPGYSAYPGVDDHEENSEVSGAIQSLCRAHGVDIVFAGHQHYYAHSQFGGVKHITNVSGAGDLRMRPCSTMPKQSSNLPSVNVVCTRSC